MLSNEKWAEKEHFHHSINQNSCRIVSSRGNWQQTICKSTTHQSGDVHTYVCAYRLVCLTSYHWHYALPYWY